jgi:ribose 5-phosphate isomerase A
MEELKKKAAEEAVKYLKPGMIVGLGSGTTVYYALKKIGEEQLDIKGIPTSAKTEELCQQFGIKTGSINEIVPEMAIDGADEVDHKKNLIKGGGGALTREKIIDYRSKKLVIIVDESKLVKQLGSTHPLPVEVLPFAWGRVQTELESMFDKVEKRRFVTDNGNFIIDCHGKIKNPKKMEIALNNIPGVVENGLFTKNVWKVVVGKEKGIKKF